MTTWYVSQEDSEGSEDDEGAMAVQAGAVSGGLRRCLTQPMPDLDLDLDDASPANGSIADRLKLLQKNGQTGWRKRIAKPSTAHDEVTKSISVSMSIPSRKPPLIFQGQVFPLSWSGADRAEKSAAAEQQHFAHSSPYVV